MNARPQSPPAADAEPVRVLQTNKRIPTPKNNKQSKLSNATATATVIAIAATESPHQSSTSPSPVLLAVSSCSSSSSFSLLEYFSSHRRLVSRLLIDLLMQIKLPIIHAIQRVFIEHANSLSLPQFVHLMLEFLHPSFESIAASLDCDSELFFHSLIELFESMDLDGSESLEYEEFLSTIVHLSLSSVDHLGLSQIQPYRLLSNSLALGYASGDKFIRYLPLLDRLLVFDREPFQLTCFDRSFSKIVNLPVTQTTVITMEFIETFGNSRLRHGNAGGSKGLKPVQLDRVEKRIRDRDGSSRERPPHDSVARSLQNRQMEIEFKHSKQLEKTAQNQIFYRRSLALQSSGSGKSDGSTATAAADSTSVGRVFDSHSSSSYFVVPHRSTRHYGYLADSLLVTSSAQYLSLFENPGVATSSGGMKLTDSKKLTSPYLTIRWSPELQKLFAGDASGALHSWKIVNSCGSAVDHRDAANLTPATECRLVFNRSFLSHTDGACCLCIIPSLGFMLSGSFDSTVRLWEIQSGKLRGIFNSHRSAVIALDYSTEFRFFVSASTDHEIHLYSPFKSSPVGRCIGHAHPLIAVQFVQQTPSIVSSDSSGTIRVWDARSFACVQIIETNNQLTHSLTIQGTIFTVDRSGLVRAFQPIGGRAASKSHEQSQSQSQTQSHSLSHVRSALVDSLYSPVAMNFVSARGREIHLTSGLNNELLRIYRGLTGGKAEITAISLDARKRKLIVGDANGGIRLFNLQTGSYIKSLTSHSSAIISIDYCDAHRVCITAASDRTVIIHDEKPIDEQLVIFQCSYEPGCEIISSAISQCVESASHLASVATSDGSLFVYSIANSGTTSLRHSHRSLISSIHFLDPMPILSTIDESGEIQLFWLRPSKFAGQPAIKCRFKEKSNLLFPMTVSTAIYCAPHNSLLIGTRQGDLLKLDFGELLSSLMADAKEIPLGESFEPTEKSVKLAETAARSAVLLLASESTRKLTQRKLEILTSAPTAVRIIRLIEKPQAILVVQDESADGLIIAFDGRHVGSIGSGIAGSASSGAGWNFEVPAAEKLIAEKQRTKLVLEQVEKIVQNQSGLS